MMIASPMEVFVFCWHRRRQAWLPSARDNQLLQLQQQPLVRRSYVVAWHVTNDEQQVLDVVECDRECNDIVHRDCGHARALMAWRWPTWDWQQRRDMEHKACQRYWQQLAELRQRKQDLSKRQHKARQRQCVDACPSCDGFGTKL